MNVANYLAVNAVRFPERIAIYQGEEPALSYAELACQAQRWATFFAQQGLAPGERVALFLSNSRVYIELLCGAWYAGLVVVPINAKLSVAEVDYIASDSGSRIVFTEHDDVAQALPGTLVLPPTLPVDLVHEGAFDRPLFRAPEAPAWIFYTSGTTGKPKGATLTHLNLAAMSACYAANIEPVTAESKLVHFAPMSHGSGLYIVPYLMAGGANVIPEKLKFSGENFVSTLAGHHHVSMFLAPTMIRRVLDYLAVHQPEYSAAHIDTITYGGGPMYAKDLDEALGIFGHRLVQIYGQGESPMTITYLGKEQHHHLSSQCLTGDDEGSPLLPVGQSHPQLEVTIQDQEGGCLPYGQEGEVCVRGDMVMAGYWNNPSATQETLRDGWLRTGDIGHLDSQGFLYLTDRLKDVIISGGTNIYPREVEEVLLQFPGVKEVSVVGRRDADWGEVVVAFISCADSLDTTALDQFCLERMARFKRPKTYHFLNDLPKNAYGKILKTELRKRLDAVTS
ncbi:Long-chain-fatty-acid--CoA ligase [Halomonas sp. NYA30]